MFEFLSSVQVVLFQNMFWWTVMCSSLAILLNFFVITSLADVTIKSRSQWGAAPPAEKPKKIDGAVAWVVIHHSAANSECSGRACSDVVRDIQLYHMKDKRWADIGYSFLVSPDGEVFEGRGWGVAGAHAPGYNDKSVGICLIGNYQDAAPPEKQLKVAQELISTGVTQGHIKPDYKLIGHRQVKQTSCPGSKLFSIIQQWSRYDKKLKPNKQ